MNCKCGGVCAFCQQAALEKENPFDRQRREARENRDKHFIDPYSLDALRAAAKEHGMVLLPVDVQSWQLLAMTESLSNGGLEEWCELASMMRVAYAALVAAAGEGE